MAMLAWTTAVGAELNTVPHILQLLSVCSSYCRLKVEKPLCVHSYRIGDTIVTLAVFELRRTVN